MRYRCLAACASFLIAGAAQAGIVFTTDNSTLLMGAVSDSDGSGTPYLGSSANFAPLLPQGIGEFVVALHTGSGVQFGTEEGGFPDNPFEHLTASGTPADLSGMYSNNPSDTNVYFVFYDQALNLSAPSFTADFCFSTSSAVCAAAAMPPSTVPEPTSVALVGVALAGLGYARRKTATGTP